ncbi:hypothetical protein [Rubritalea tangerina]|uniref:hypothetical protein n=1 Tax=Rubritalea tangerina TaxID=430798 RepID=UPI0036170791
MALAGPSVEVQLWRPEPERGVVLGHEAVAQSKVLREVLYFRKGESVVVCRCNGLRPSAEVVLEEGGAWQVCVRRDGELVEVARVDVHAEGRHAMVCVPQGERYWTLLVAMGDLRGGGAYVYNASDSGVRVKVAGGRRLSLGAREGKVLAGKRGAQHWTVDSEGAEGWRKEWMRGFEVQPNALCLFYRQGGVLGVHWFQGFSGATGSGR